MVKIKAAAVCGTDLRIYKNGHFRIQEGEERILGHECSGVIAEASPGVHGFEPGMKVGIASNVGCGKCRYCRMGQTNWCTEYIAFGITLDGGFSEYMKIPAEAVERGNLVPFSGEASFEEVALAEPLSCVYHAWRSVDTCPGDTVLIVGAGPMGVLHLQLQLVAGASKVMLADVSSERLALIKSLPLIKRLTDCGLFNPDLLINTTSRDLHGAVMEATEGEGADVVITACPVPEVQSLAVKMAARLGRINFFGGLPKGKEQVPLDTNAIHYKGLIVTGTTGGSISDHESSMKLILEKKIDVASLVSKRFDLTNIREAFDYALSGAGLKTMLVF